MKTTKFYGVLSFLMIAFTITSCVKDGDFTVPNISVEEPSITTNSSIMAIKTALQQYLSGGRVRSKKKYKKAQ